MSDIRSNEDQDSGLQDDLALPASGGTPGEDIDADFDDEDTESAEDQSDKADRAQDLTGTTSSGAE